MPSSSPLHTTRRPLATALAVALAIALVVLLQAAGSASGQTKSEQLAQVRDRQADVAAEAQAANQRVDALIGEVSALRQQEQEANDELAQREAELTEATETLDNGREKLVKLREKYAASSKRLQGMLVAMYKARGDEVTAALLRAESFGDLAAETEYMNRISEYQSAVITRAAELRDKTDALVSEMAAAREQIEAARDEIAARRDELSANRAALEEQQSALAAAYEERRATLESLESREGQLVRQINAAEPAPAPTSAAPEESSAPAPAPVPGSTASIGADGQAIPPADAPPQVVAAIEAANRIEDMPYVWGGGHGSFEASGYDCSGAVSYALHGAGVLDSPLDSTGLMSWGEAGAGQWITVYANSGHTYAVIAGLRWDTSGTGGSGPGWSTSLDGYLDPSAYTVRHPSGL
jgi:peptidoglycan hydrolase CwlO-like protein